MSIRTRARGAGAALVAAAAAAALAAAPSAAGGATPVKRTIKVLDDYFQPSRKLTVPRRSTIVWKWDADNGNTHDVKLVRRPKGVRRFHSLPATSDYSFRRRLKVRGTYKVICTYHRLTMRQTFVVK